MTTRRSAGALPAEAPQGLARSWTQFWLAPVAPTGLHAVRVLAGLLFLTWLLAFAGHQRSLFGLGGWFDRQAYLEVSPLTDNDLAPPGWSLVYLAGGNEVVVDLLYWGAVGVLVLFTLGVCPRLTSVLAWVVVVSFTANPATLFDPDWLLIALAFYLMVGYVLWGQWSQPRTSWLSLGTRAGPGGLRDLLGPGAFLFRRPAPEDEPPSHAANLALRLMQVHFALVIVAGGLSKLQFAEWWGGVAFWYPLHPAMELNRDIIRARSRDVPTYLFVMSLAQYVLLAWQIGFPLVAWRRALRPILLGGALAGWLGCLFIYRQPLIGPITVIACLSFLTPAEWQRLLAWRPRLGRLAGRALPAAKPEPVTAGAGAEGNRLKVGRRSAAVVEDPPRGKL